MITFAPHEFMKTVTVNIEDDDIVEYNEMFFGRLSTTDPLVQVTDGEATITIMDEVDSEYALTELYCTLKEPRMYNLILTA